MRGKLLLKIASSSFTALRSVSSCALCENKLALAKRQASVIFHCKRVLHREEGVQCEKMPISCKYQTLSITLLH